MKNNKKKINMHKKIYVSPKIIEIASIKKITLGGNPAPTFDSGVYGANPPVS